MIQDAEEEEGSEEGIYDCVADEMDAVSEEELDALLGEDVDDESTMKRTSSRPRSSSRSPPCLPSPAPPPPGSS